MRFMLKTGRAKSIGKEMSALRSNRACQTMILGSMPRDKSLLTPPRVRTNRALPQDVLGSRMLPFAMVGGWAGRDAFNWKPSSRKAQAGSQF